MTCTGFTLNGPVDVGYGYDTAGVRFGNSYRLLIGAAPRSLADNNLNPPANQTPAGDGSRAGPWDNSQGFAGVSSKTHGTLTAGSVNALSADVMTAP